ncbi:hypothetical protein [Faecalibacterium prausnitzii]|uniref:hypothetical protein n=1 Tax=Faecalibacterium prausnitzii TaxID=853 RepID=UPI001F3148BD|nr:hypothetical protein [Faecalibacterium prausnitzii]
MNLRRKRGEHHETGIPADGDLQPSYACKGLQKHRLAAATAPVRRICGRAGYTLDGEQELPVRKLLHRAQDGSCLAELPGFNIAQLRLSYRELEQLAAQKGWTLQKL